MDGETFAVFSKIGFWDKIHRENLPHTKFIMMDNIENHAEIIRNSILPCFVTDMSLIYYKRRQFERVAIPIEDEVAHAKFFIWERA